MRKKTMKKGIALLLALSLAIPVVSMTPSASVVNAADISSANEVGDINGNGIAASDLVAVKKNSANLKLVDLNNDGKCDAADAMLMRDYLLGKITAFYRPDTSVANNDTYLYTATDAFDRLMANVGATNTGKTVGIRYFLHMGAGSNKLYSVSNILKADANAYLSNDAWLMAGGGAVGQEHWWGESLFGYYTSMDEWVVDKDVQMLTDAGVDFIAIDTADGTKVYEEQLGLLLSVLGKYKAQGFEVPKVTFMKTGSTVNSALQSFYENKAYEDLWYVKNGTTIKSVDELTVKSVPVAKSYDGTAMSESAFYGDSYNHQRTYNGATNLTGDKASLLGYNFEYEFKNAMSGNAGTVLVESWNEWISVREKASDSSKPIVLKDNADLNNSSDIQPMKDGYGDSYYMQLVDCIKRYKGAKITNNRLNTATVTEGVAMDMTADFQQWNKVSTHYLDYTQDILDRKAGGYEGEEVRTISSSYLEISFAQIGGSGTNFITKDAYAGGSTVTFDMFVPSGTGAEWAAVGYSTSATSLSPDIYSFYGTLGTCYADSKYEWGKWVTCTVQLPADSNSYYVWIAGEPGKNFNNQLTLIDNFKVTKGNNVLVNEDFEDKEYSDTFNVKSGVASIHTDTSIVLPEAEKDLVAAIEINKVSGNANSFITKKAYAGGSTVSFRAYVPANATWWSVCWTTDVNQTDRYAHTTQKGSAVQSVVGAWSDYSFTLPDDGNNYYVYISGAEGEWGTAKALIDDFKVTKNGLTYALENFNSGLDDSIFTVNTSAAISTQEVEKAEAATYKAAAIDINQIAEDNTMSFVTKHAYPANSTITLRAFVPEGINDGSWWAIGASTSTTGSIYTWVDGTAFSTDGKKGAWGTYTVTIPDGEGPYYLSIVGNKGQWNGKQLIIDDFKVVTADGAWAEDDFQNGLTSGMFSVNTDTAISWVTVKEENIVYTDESGQNDIDKMKMTTDGTNLYAFVETVGAIKGFGNANCMSLFISTGNSGGCWNQYEFVVNRDSSKATAEGLTIEQYVAGAWKVVGYASYKLEGNRLQLAIPLELLQVNSAFSLEFKWADNYDENDIYSFYTKGDAAPYGRANYVYEVSGKVAAIDVDFLTAEGAMDFITKQMYPSGTKVSVKAYVPEGIVSGAWWSLGCTENKSNSDIYTFLKYIDTTGSVGTWNTYEAELSKDAYIFIAGEKGKWNGNELLIESVTITTPNGPTVKDNFTGGFTHGLFDVNTTDASDNVIAHLQTVEEDKTDKVAQIDMDNINANGTSFITKVAYPGGSKATFKAKVSAPDWWGFAYATTPGSSDVYQAAQADKNLMSVTTVGEWKEYTIQIPAGDTPYYIYIGCSMDPVWANKPVLLDDFKVYNAAGELIAKDNFNLASEQRLFDTDAHVEYVKTQEEVVSGNQAASIKSGANASAFISRNAYPAGSTITFDAKVASTGDWTLNWTTNADGSGTAAASNKISYVHGAWADNYTYTAPTSGGPYYIYIAGSDSTNATLLVDNVKVAGASGSVMAQDGFNHPFSQSMFAVNTSYVSLAKVEADVVEDGIDFNAYGAPTVGGNVSEATAAQLNAAYADMAAAGFTKAIAMHEGYSEATGSSLLETSTLRTNTADEAAALAIQAAEANNILYYVKDTSFYNLGKDSNDASVINADTISKEADFKSVIENVFSSATGSKSYLTSSAYAGHFAADEPTYKGKDLTAVKYQTNYYNAQMNELGVQGEMLVNLFGAFYAKTNGFLGIGNYDYTDYIKSYLENGGTELGYISWDNYPFLDSSKESEEGAAANHLSTYLYNYEYLASVAKTNNLELRNVVQSMGDGTGVRELTGPDDLRFQIYSGLAFGVKEFTYYQYSNSSTRNDGTKGFLYEYSTQETTTTYDWAKEVNNEVHAIEDALNQYQWSKSYVVDNGATNEMIGGMTSAVKTNGTKITMSTSGDILASEFTAKKSENINTNAYMFVNVEYNNASGSAKIVDGSVKKDVTVTFPSGTTALSIYQGGEQKIVPISGTSYTFSIGGGEGVFVIPLS